MIEKFGYENQEDKVIQPPDRNGFKHVNNILYKFISFNNNTSGLNFITIS